MDNYIYIIAGLPDLRPDWKAPEDFSADRLVEEIKSQCSSRDCETIGFLLKGFDADSLCADFYKSALSHKEEFIREYFRYDLGVRNTKVHFINKSLGRPMEQDIVDIPEAELGEKAARVEAAFSNSDLLVREKAVDDLMWEHIDSLTQFKYFEFTVILAFIAKLKIVDRWLKLDPETGRRMFMDLVAEIRGTFKGVEFDN